VSERVASTRARNRLLAQIQHGPPNPNKHDCMHHSVDEGQSALGIELGSEAGGFPLGILNSLLQQGCLNVGTLELISFGFSLLLLNHHLKKITD